MLASDADMRAYEQRAAAVLDANVSSIRGWASTTAAVADNAPTSGISIWTAAAAYARSGTDAALLPVAEKAAASLLEKRATALFAGGNDGWEAWATADTFLRYRPLIAAASGRYRPTGLTPNPASLDGAYSLQDLFKHVLTKSFYAPIDSTSNHVLMNATARYLAEQAFPGEVVKPYNNSLSDPTGASTILTRAQGLVTDGPAEYLSLNYGGYNWAEFLSVFQLTNLSANADLARISRVAFETAFAMNAAYWMNGQLAGPVGRGYPNTGAWGASGGDSLTWTYLGGDFGQASQQLAYAASTDVKSLGVLASVACFGVGSVTPYVPPAALLHLDDPVAKVTRSNFGTNHQYAYNVGSWSTSSESYKWDAYGPYQATWRSRTIWTKPESQTYQAVAWATNPATDPGPNADGSWNYVDPYTLEAWNLSGSGTYSGSSVFSDMVQNLGTVLQVYNIPPLAIAGTPGGKTPVRGTLIYVPVPQVTATGADAADGDGWFRPVISRDAHRLFVAYEGVFICFLSTAPISAGSRVAQKQFFNIYGGTSPGQQADPDTFLQYAVAQETFSPTDFPGTTLAERFANFQTVMSTRLLPQLVTADTYHPAWRYADGTATLTSEFGGIERYAKDPKALTKACGEDTVGGLGDVGATVVDYASWPMLEIRDLEGRTWASQVQDGNLAITVPSQAPLAYDFGNWRSSTGSDIGLRATSPSGGQIRLDWQANLGATGFRVERSSDGLSWTTLAGSLPATSTSYTDGSLTQKAALLYRVTPLGTPLGTSLPAGTSVRFSAPTSLRLTLNTTSQITLAWANTASGNTSVQLQYSLDGSSQWRWLVNLPASYTSRTVAATDFTGGERVFYRALAYGVGPNNTTLFSTPSNVVGTEFSPDLIGGVTSMPEFLVARGATDRITLAWLDTATNETAYRVDRSTDDGRTWSTLSSTLPAGASAFTDTAVVPGASYCYRVAAVNAAATSAFSNVVTAAAVADNAAPVIATPASVPGVVIGTSAPIGVLGGDDAGEPNLRYSWSVAAGPGAVAFAANGTNAAKTTMAIFSRAGTYRLTARIEDAAGLVTTSSADVTVKQTATSLAVTPALRTIRTNSSLALEATLADQFGHPLSVPDIIDWTTTAGAVDVAGRLTAPGMPGLALVSASVAGLTAFAAVTIQSAPLPLASYAFEDGAGTLAVDASGNGFHATLSGGVAFGAGATVKGVASGGLVFAGTGVATIGDPAPLSFTGAVTLAAWVRSSGTSGLQSIIEKGYTTGSGAGEIFLRINAGSYQVGSYDGTSAYASMTIPAGDVGQWVHLLGTYDAAQQKWLLYRNGVQGASSGTTTKGAVAVAGRNWTIGATAIGNRFFTGSIDEVRIGNTSTTAAQALAAFQSFTGPSVVVPAASTPQGNAGITLTALGASPQGESGLTYTWSTLGVPPAPVAFSANATNAAKATIVNFSANGTYTFAVVIADPAGVSVHSIVSVVVTGAADDVIDVPAGAERSLPATAGGRGRLVKRGTGTLLIPSAHAYFGGLVVEAGDVVLGASPTGGAGDVTIGSRGHVTLAHDVTLGRLDIAAGGGFDVDAARVVVHGTSATTLVSLLRLGLGDGGWNGTTGIHSAAAAAGRGQSLLMAVGWIDNGDGSFTVAPAYAGDTNLDGVVDILDVMNLLGGGSFSSGSSASWSDGDFNYDGVIDDLDLADLIAADQFDREPYRPGIAADRRRRQVTPVPA